MANIIITFATVFPHPDRQPRVPIPVGNSARTEEFDLTTSPDVGELECEGDENIVSIYAGEAAWVTIGQAPTAALGDGWFFAAGASKEFWVNVGDKVAAVGLA